MGKNCLKEELLTLYDAAYNKAMDRTEHTVANELRQAAERIATTETLSDLLSLLVHDCVELLTPIEQAAPIGRCLQTLVPERLLQEAGIYCDLFPAGLVQQGREYLFINTSPTRLSCTLDVDARVAFLGRWTVDARETFIEAFSGTHLTLRGDKANAHLLAPDCSAIVLPDAYYQLVDSPTLCQQAERVLAVEGEAAVLRLITGQASAAPAIDLQRVRSAVTCFEDERIVAEGGRYTLVQGSDKGLKLYQRHSEQEVIEALRQRDDISFLSPDVWSLNTALKRDEFLKLPEERLAIGLNHRGEEVVLTMNVSNNCYKIHNLYMPDGKEWKPCNTNLDMNPHASLADEIRLVKFQLSDYLKQTESQERKPGLHR